MIVIVKCGFDSLENHSPYYYEFVGCADNDEAADKWIEENDKKLHKFKGWNGLTYPTYIKLNVGELKQGDDVKENIYAYIDNTGSVYQYNKEICERAIK